MAELKKLATFFVHSNKATVLLISTIFLCCCAADVHSASGSTFFVEGENSLETNIHSRSVIVTPETKTKDPSSLIQAKDIIEDAYRNCNNADGVKVCHGDTDGCVSSKSCSHMSALIMSQTHYNVIIYTKCSSDSIDSYFLSVTINDTLEITEDEETGNVTVTCSPLERKNFKLFKLWPKDEKKCDPGTTDYTINSATYTNDLSLVVRQESCNNRYKNSTGDEDFPLEFDFVYWHENLLSMAMGSNSFFNFSYTEIEEMVEYSSTDNIFYTSIVPNSPSTTPGSTTTTESLALNHRSFFSFHLFIVAICLSLISKEP